MKESRCLLCFFIFLLSCRAEKDFSSDIEQLGLWLGLAELGGCAEITNSGAYYTASLWGVPGRLCTTSTRSGNSYSEYLEIAVREHKLIAERAEEYRIPSCSDEVDILKGYPSDPTLTNAIAAGLMVRSSASYSAPTVWVPIASDIVVESKGFLAKDWSMTAADIDASRQTTYAEYLSISAGLYINYISGAVTNDTTCQTEGYALLSSLHPGWLGYQIGDSTTPIKKVVLSRCQYGTAPATPEWLCTTLGPQF